MGGVVRRISDSLNAVAMAALFLLIAAMIVVITLQVVARVWFTALSWTEEASRYLLVWSSMIGASIGVKRGSHIAVTFVVGLLPGLMQKIVGVVMAVLACGFFAAGVFYGTELFNRTVFQTSPALELPMRYVYLAIPLSSGIMLVHGLSALLETLGAPSREVK
ncbi:MAG: TRAP transporter small permease [Firmicutes bacterium]|nr:TRAP transporter small permease [Bacillota bacterium]